jgi:hypothetical protein
MISIAFLLINFLSILRYFSIPLLFRTRENEENSLIYRVLMIRVISEMDSTQIYSLIE